MYKLTKKGEWFLILKGTKPLLTPMDQPVRTTFAAIADKLVEHLEKYGEDPSNPVSIVAFHYAMLDFFLTNAPGRTRAFHCDWPRTGRRLDI